MTRPDDGNLNVVNISIKPQKKNTFNKLSYEVVILILIESSSD